MEIYTVTRYENIADRLKRLGNNNQQSSNNLNNNLKEGNRCFQTDKNFDVSTNTNKISKESKMNQKCSQYPKNYLQKLQNQPQISQNSQKTYRLGQEKNLKTNNFTFIQSNCTDEGQLLKKQQLSKIKSDGNLKINAIIESYNNYKNNKRNFLANLGKTIPKNQKFDQESQKQISYFDQSCLSNQQTNQSIFEQIDNLWKDGKDKTQEEDQKLIPKFQRSRKYLKTNFSDLNKSLETQNQIAKQNDDKLRPRIISKSKLIYKNIGLKQSEYRDGEPKLAINTLISPRNDRMPGKIIKNTNKTMKLESRQIKSYFNTIEDELIYE